MTTQDLMNDVLWNLQQSELVNFGNLPNYAGATNPPISQSALIFQINRAYERVYQDLSDCEVALSYYSMTSIANISDYPLPPGGAIPNIYNPSSTVPNINLTAIPNVQRISRVIYNPVGQPWTQMQEGGVRLVSWKEFNGWCAYGYLRPFTFNIIPDYVTVTPNRQILSFFPGTASNGDIIGVEYVPKLTVGTSVPPLTVALPLAQPVLPDEASDMIIFWATSLCWPKLREMQAAKEYETKYYAEMARVREMIGPRSRGDTYRITDASQDTMLSYPIGGAAGLAMP